MSKKLECYSFDYRQPDWKTERPFCWKTCLHSPAGTEEEICYVKNKAVKRVTWPGNAGYLSVQFSSVHSLSCVWLFATPWIAAGQASLSITNSRSSLRLNVHRVRDAIQPSHPQSSPSPPAPNPSQHQSHFQWVNSLHEMAKVLEFQLQHHSFQRNPRADLLQNGLIGSPCTPRDSEESSPTPQFKSINSSALSLLHSPTLTSIHDHRKNHSLD